MKIHPGKKNHGIAVIVALIAITVLSIMAAGFALSMKVETTLAANANSDEQMLWLGRSGMEYARWILAQEASIPAEPYDSLNQKWAGGEGDLNESNSVLSSISLDNVPVGENSISVKIIDLERKINVNAANTAVLQQVLTAMGVDADNLSVVSDSIQDWVQPGEAPRIAGAKSDYYQALTPPYYCKESPIDDLSELLLVRGVTPAMYWGGSETNHQGAAFQHKLGFGHAPGEAPSYVFGFTNVFTPVSTGQININTADINVLMSLPGMDNESAQNIIKWRSGPDGVEGTADDTPFRNVGQLSAAGVDPRVVQQMSQFCTVRSSTFDVTVKARIGQLTREYHAILLRKSGTDIQVVGFYWQ